MPTLATLKNHSINLIIADLQPNNHPPLDQVFDEFDRLITPTGVICLFATMPFACDLIAANRKIPFRYDLIWETPDATIPEDMPQRNHELILIFYKKLPTYNPQKTPGKPYTTSGKGSTTLNYGEYKALPKRIIGEMRHPKSVLQFTKPELIEWLKRTYSNEEDTTLQLFPEWML